MTDERPSSHYLVTIDITDGRHDFTEYGIVWCVSDLAARKYAKRMVERGGRFDQGRGLGYRFGKVSQLTSDQTKVLEEFITYTETI